MRKCPLSVEKSCRGQSCPDIVHIAFTPYYKEAFDMLLPYATSRTCFFIGSPYATKEKRQWWKQVVADSRTGVTFDLYDVGLVFLIKKDKRTSHCEFPLITYLYYEKECNLYPDGRWWNNFAGWRNESS